MRVSVSVFQVFRVFRVLWLLWISLTYTRNMIIVPTNVSATSVIVHFDWDNDILDVSSTTWRMEFWKHNQILWQRILDSRPISIGLTELEESKNYTVILKNTRDLHFLNIIYTADILLRYSSSFVTVPRELLITKYWKSQNIVTVRTSIQIHCPEKYEWSVEWKYIEDAHFDHKTPFREFPEGGHNQLDIDIDMPWQDCWVLARVRVKTKPEYPHAEEYYGPTQFIHI